MEGSVGRNLIMGFIAAAIAVLTVHQLMYVLVTQLGLAKLEPWSMKGVAPYNVPTIVNAMFWGGLWGALFGLIHDKLPGGMFWLKGLIYGLLIVVLSNWLLLPLIKGNIFGVPNQVLFAGGNTQRLIAGALILGGFGTALGVIYGLINRRG